MPRQFEGNTVVRVFFTTPQAAQAQQAAFREVIGEANVVKARAHGVQFKPVGGGGSMLGRLRARARGAKEVLSADLVVAVLGQHGDAAARFETSYDLACQHGKPLWLYVRALDDALLADPDESLRHVLTFRDRAEQDGHARITRYTDDAAWPGALLQDLFHWLDDLLPDPSPGPADAGGLVARQAVYADSGASPSAAVFDRMQEAWQLAKDGRLTSARVHFVRLLAEAPSPAVQCEYARFLTHLGMLDEAEALNRQALDAAPADVQALLAAGYDLLGHAHEHRADLDAAKRLYREALALHERLDRPGALAAAYGSLGNVHWRLSELEKAEDAYRASLALHERLGHRHAVAADYGKLGNVYGVWSRLDQAEAMYRKALALNEELGQQEGMANQYGNLGILYRVQGRLDEAEAVYRKALAINSALDYREGMAEDYNNLGNIFQERGDLDEAEVMYRKALGIDEALGRQEGMANQYGNLGILDQARKRYDEAEIMYRRALTIYETLGDFVTIEQVRIWITDLEAHRRLQ